jgi:hypothetical protein
MSTLPSTETSILPHPLTIHSKLTIVNDLSHPFIHVIDWTSYTLDTL